MNYQMPDFTVNIAICNKLPQKFLLIQMEWCVFKGLKNYA